MDLSLAEAVDTGAHVADRQRPRRRPARRGDPATPTAACRRLGGDEIGWLLADYLLRPHLGSDDRVVITTARVVVVARRHGRRQPGVHYGRDVHRVQVDRAHDPRPPRDGGSSSATSRRSATSSAPRPPTRTAISAAVLLAEIAASARPRASHCRIAWTRSPARIGLHATDQWSVRLEGAEGAARIASVMDGLRRDPPGERAEPEGLPPADIVMLRIGADRVVVRPSGTEPKLKMYFEVVIPVSGSIDDAPRRGRQAIGRAPSRARRRDRPVNSDLRPG